MHFEYLKPTYKQTFLVLEDSFMSGINEKFKIRQKESRKAFKFPYELRFLGEINKGQEPGTYKEKY